MKQEHVSKIVGVFAALVLSISGIADNLDDLVKNKKYDEAFRLAHSLSNKEAGNSKFDMMYGIAAREVGHPEIAYFAFERVLMTNKKDARAHYEMALTLFKLTDYRGSKKALEQTLKLANSATLKSNAAQLLSVVETALNRQESPLVFLQGTFDIGYNSNTNSVALDWLNLGFQSGPSPDGFVNFNVAAFVEKKISKKDSLYFSLATGYRKNFQSKRYDFNTLFARTGYQTSIGELTLKVPFSMELYVLNYNPALLSESVGFEFGKEWEETHFLSVGAFLKAKQFQDRTDNAFLGNFELSYKGRFCNILGIDVKAFYNPTFTRGYNGVIGGAVKDEIGGLLRGSWELMRSHSVFAEAKYTNYAFWAPSGFQNIAHKNDHIFGAQVGYRWKISRNFALGPSYNFTYNLSNVASNTYMRHQVQLGLVGSF